MKKEEMEKAMDEMVSKAPKVVSCKTEIIEETENERIVREVFEEPETFTMVMTMVLETPMEILSTTMVLGNESVEVRPSKDEVEDGEKAETP